MIEGWIAVSVEVRGDSAIPQGLRVILKFIRAHSFAFKASFSIRRLDLSASRPLPDRRHYAPQIALHQNFNKLWTCKRTARSLVAGTPLFRVR